jgi:hypothetical protein
LDGRETEEEVGNVAMNMSVSIEYEREDVNCEDDEAETNHRNGEEVRNGL